MSSLEKNILPPSWDKWIARILLGSTPLLMAFLMFWIGGEPISNPEPGEQETWDLLRWPLIMFLCTMSIMVFAGYIKMPPSPNKPEPNEKDDNGEKGDTVND